MPHWKQTNGTGKQSMSGDDCRGVLYERRPCSAVKLRIPYKSTELSHREFTGTEEQRNGQSRKGMTRMNLLGRNDVQ